MSKVDFISGCPVANCENNKRQIHWVHSSCGGYETISEDGIIQCKNCYTSGIFLDWSFNCGKHCYQKGSLQGFLNAITILGNLNVSPLFLLKLTKSVTRQFENI